MTASDGRAERRVTIYDVAREAGVSHQTVSRHLRGAARISPATREKVERAIVAMGYQTNVAARHLRGGRTGLIALSIPSLNQPYFAELAQSVIHAAREHDLSVFVETTELDRDRELFALGHLRNSLVDGILFVATALDAEDLERATPNRPVVLLGDRINKSRFDHITMANREAAAAATTLLLERGRRRIVALGVQPGAVDGAAPLRLAGYLDAHANAGLTPDPALLVTGDEWVRQVGEENLCKLVSEGAEFDAVFAFNDALALGALRALARAGLRVPDDVMVVGFDDTEDASFSTPTLSSVSPGREDIARLAVDLLVELMGGAPSAGREIEVPFEVVARESTEL